MERYIVADTLIAHLKDEIEGCKPHFCGRANGKSIAYGTILGLKSAISFAETLSTADVVPKSEVERLEKKIQRLTISMNAYGLGMVRIKEEKYNLTMEIFADIESDIEKLVQDARNCQEEYQSPAAKPFITLCEGKLSGLGEAKQVISQLKKKYTGGK